MGTVERRRRQKDREQAAALRLADALNLARGTDYSVQPGSDPPDYFLRSAPRQWPELGVEVTSFPIGEYWNREDNGHLDRLTENLQEWVKRWHPRGYFLSVQAAEDLRRDGLSIAELESVLQCLGEACRGLVVNQAAEHLEEKLPAPLSKKFTLILVMNSGKDVTTELWTSMEHELLPTGLWISEAVARKAKSYGGKSNCDILALDGFLTQGQIADARRMLSEQQVPFREVWLVGRFNEPIQLK